MARRRAVQGERGSAVVDFVLVSLVLVPLVLGIIQVALVMFVHNTLASAASEGARFGATIDRSPGDGAARTRQQINDAVADRFARDVTARATEVDGVPGVVVHVHAVVPALGLWGPGVALDIDGHAVKEQAP